MNKNAQAGFTLMEILIAIAIVGLLATVSLSLFRYFASSQKKAAVMALKTLKNAIGIYYTDVGQYPEQLKDLVQKPSDEAAARSWNGEYIQGKDALRDPWKRKYEYKRTEGAEHDYELYSYGEKGKNSPKSEWISVWDL